MSGIWSQIKKTTAIGMQMFKEAAMGADGSEQDPVYENAMARFNTLQRQAQMILADFENIVHAFMPICNSALTFSSIAIEADQQVDGLNSQSLNLLHTFFLKQSACIGDSVLKYANGDIREPLESALLSLTNLNDLIDSRRKLQLLCDSLRSDLENANKSKKQPKIDAAKQKYEKQQSILNEQTSAVVNAVNSLWQQRYTMIEVPMKRFVAFAAGLFKDILQEFSALNGSLAPEDLQREYQME